MTMEDEARRYTEARKKFLEKLFALIAERLSHLEDGGVQLNAAENLMRTEFPELCDELFEAESAFGEVRNQADKAQTEYLTDIKRWTTPSPDAPAKKEEAK